MINIVIANSILLLTYFLDKVTCLIIFNIDSQQNPYLKYDITICICQRKFNSFDRYLFSGCFNAIKIKIRLKIREKNQYSRNIYSIQSLCWLNNAHKDLIILIS